MPTTIIVTYSSETVGENVKNINKCGGIRCSHFQSDKTIKGKEEAKDDKKADKNDRRCSHFQSDKTMKKKKKKKMMTKMAEKQLKIRTNMTRM